MRSQLDIFTLVASWYERMPTQAKYMLFAAFFLMVLGNTLLIYVSCRRRGVSFLKAMLPTAEGLELAFDLNKIEITILVVLTVVCSGLATIALIMSENPAFF